ncbi:hypothetical protein MSMAP_0991 [Methanosarcina mazei SarPi]|uniref:Uncharacterized protein n=1 Tax=Methanosarcina mazei SarPi TaxID=1434115 RepID=A0A0E3LS14_METMZ|nr:hypothetical protein MSMAP_0991 [Methanosarcina mazei SarPi]
MVLDAALRKKSRNNKPVNTARVTTAYIPAFVWLNLRSLLMHFAPVSPVSHKPNCVLCFIFNYSHYPAPFTDPVIFSHFKEFILLNLLPGSKYFLIQSFYKLLASRVPSRPSAASPELRLGNTRSFSLASLAQED